MTFVFQSRPSLRDCGASIVQSALFPKLVYMLAYAKAMAAQLLEIEQSYSLILRHSLSCDASFPWDVLTGATEQDGLGAVRLATEVTRRHGCDTAKQWRRALLQAKTSWC